MGFLTQYPRVGFHCGRLWRPFLFCLAFALTACAIPGPQQRVEAAKRLVLGRGWQSEMVAAGRFNLQAFFPPPEPSEKVVIYLEGDGLAWLDASTPSPDPTPVNPLGLHMAMQHPAANVAYLGRPCQYDPESRVRQCGRRDWTDARFSAEIVIALSSVIDQIKAKFSARQIILVGYSGGGTLAALIAARRSDVVQLVTVAAVLDHRAWTEYLGVTPLSGSLNPVDDWERLRSIPQTHLFGAEDKTTGRIAIQPYADRARSGDPIEMRRLEGFDHACCWVKAWPGLWRDLSVKALPR